MIPRCTRFSSCAFLALSYLTLTLLPGCGGGGGGAGEGGIADAGSRLPAPGPLNATQPAENFLDPEFERNYGLGMIEVQEAYALGATGKDVIVAVIDSGIDGRHIDLSGKISPYSIDIVRPEAELEDGLGHGTAVSGVIAASRNDYGLHGVAFDASILSIRADARDEDGASLGFFEVSDIADALEHASGTAHVINMSLGAPEVILNSSFGEDFERALTGAMDSGAIIVGSAGNSSDSAPALPAAYAGSETINASGQMIAVAAVNAAGSALASFSNQCGSAKDYCLVAPGEDIWSTKPVEYTGANVKHRYDIFSGTSFAAPHVAGAAALLIQLWPSLEPAEVVKILLASATDLGDEGVDPVYGHGLLNMANAVAPVGTLTLPLSGGSTEIEGTNLFLGPAFGDALTDNTLLGQSFALDAYGRDYGIDLRKLVQPATSGFGLPALIQDGRRKTIGATAPAGLSLSLDVTDRDGLRVPAPTELQDSDGSSLALNGLSLAGELSGNTAFRLGYNLTPGQQLPGAEITDAGKLFWMSGDILAPQHELIGNGNGGALTIGDPSGTGLSVGWVTEGPDTGSRIGEISLIHRFENGATLMTGYSHMTEEDGFLGADASGGFAVEGAKSRFFSIGGYAPIGAKLNVIGSYTLGETQITADGTSLLGDWSRARANAYGVGFVWRGLFGPLDSLGFLAGQPLRVHNASAVLTTPAGYGADESVSYESERVSLIPSGREIDLQLAYERAIGNNIGISAWLMMQTEPGHVAGAPPAQGIGLQFSMNF